jgi:hypothetical protein
MIVIFLFEEYYESTYRASDSIQIFGNMFFLGNTINKSPPISNYSLDWWRNRNCRELKKLIISFNKAQGRYERKAPLPQIHR